LQGFSLLEPLKNNSINSLQTKIQKCGKMPLSGLKRIEIIGV